MSRHRYGVVSSLSSRGTPESALVGIATTLDLEIIFDTLQSSRKFPNLIAQPACSLVVGWEGEQTLQFEGMAATLTRLRWSATKLFTLQSGQSAARICLGRQSLTLP